MSPLFALVFLLGLSWSSCLLNFSTVYEWAEREVDYVWPSHVSKRKALEDGDFMASSIEAHALAVYKDRLFLSLANYHGVPVTLVSIPTGNATSAPPKLAPFPSWKLHEKHRCNGILKPRGIKADSHGRLWVVDDGRGVECMSKLWIFDLNDNDKTELVYNFPYSVVYRSRNLDGIVLDETPDDIIAYVTDPSWDHIVAFSLKKKETWLAKTTGKKLTVLVLSPREEARQLYFGAIDSKELFSIPVSQLRVERQNAIIPESIGTWNEEPYELFIDGAGVLYAASFNNFISSWNISEPFSQNRVPINKPENLRTVGPHFIFALDSTGTLWMIEQRNSEEYPKLKLFSAPIAVSTGSSLASSHAIQSGGPVSINILICSVQPCVPSGKNQNSDSQGASDISITVSKN